VNRLVRVAAILSLLASARASAVVLTSSWPIIGGSIPVTLTLTDVAAGNAVEITVSIPEGEGDILGLFGNVVNESLVPQLDAVGSLVTQEQYAANQVYKVGGGNEMTPVTGWDWGLRFESTNWQTEDIHTVTFQLTAPGLTVAQLADAANQGWYFGVRVQHMLGPKSKGSIGFPVTPPPPGTPPTIAIAAPLEGALLAQSGVVVSGPITGTPPLSVSVNGLWSPLTNGGTAFARTMTLADGTQIVRAAIGNSYGYMIDEVSVTVDTTPPVVEITLPPDGALTTSASIAVSGTAIDATSGVASVTMNGIPATLNGTVFTATVPLVLGANTITAIATDLAGRSSTPDVISVTRSAPPGFAINIETPVAGTLFSTQRIEVAGSVSDPSAQVVVNGVVATVTGARWVAAQVPLLEGQNTLDATATRPEDTAMASVVVAYNAPPVVVILTPGHGDLFRTGTTDVDGFVDDASAFVDVNGVTASVESGGRFSAIAVPLVPGDNTLIARAIDPLGAKGADAVSVIRDDQAIGRSALVVVDRNNAWVPGAAAFSTLTEWDENLDAGNASQLSSRPFDVTRSRMTPVPDLPIVYAQPQVLLLSEQSGNATFESFRETESSPLRGPYTSASVPIEELESYVDPSSAVLPGVLDPAAFPARFFANVYDLLEPCPIDASCSPSAIQGGRVRLRATLASVQNEISLTTDVRRPVVDDFSPSFGSVVAGNVVTVTGVVRDAGPLLDSVAYTVRDGLGLVVREGLVPLVVEETDHAPEAFRGRFAIPDLVLADGLHFVAVTAWDAIGNRTPISSGTEFTMDADAPAVTLFSPLDGSAFVESEVQASLNFGAPTTLLSVNGVPDGRTFATGIASNVLLLPLLLGPNLFELEVQNSAGIFTTSFTLHRVAEREPVRIVTPTEGQAIGTRHLTVTGTVPIGTPAVVVNGVLGEIAPDRATFTASIPIPSTGLEVFNGEARTKPYPIMVEALPLGTTASVRITPDFLAPSLRTLLPEDGSLTLDSDLSFGGFLSEDAHVTLESTQDALTSRTLRDRAREEREPFNLFNVFQFHRFEFSPLAIDAGVNTLTLRARDAAGNELVQPITVTRAGATLAITAPAAGSSVAALKTDFTLAASAPVTLDAFVVAGRSIPALAGLAVAPGTLTLTDVPLAPGPNAVRVVYHRDGGPQEVLGFDLTSTAMEFATVSGRVTDERTGAGLGGALVNVSAGGVSFTITTDTQGFYRADVVPGAVTVVTAAEGYAPSNASGTAPTGTTLTSDLALDATGLPAVLNEVRILVPPLETITDFEQLTVVGTVLHPSSTVVVNGIAAEVVGNRFKAKHVPLAMGANTLQVSAAVLGLPNVTTSRSIERSSNPVLQVMLFSPPDGVRVPGGGLVVRGFVSASDARALVADRFAPIVEGIVVAEEVDVQTGLHPIALVAEVDGSSVAMRDEVRVQATSSERALRLDADPTTASAPFDATLRVSANVPGIDIVRLDFDVDGDGDLDVLASAGDSTEATYVEPRRYEARAYVATPSGAEFSAATRIGAYLPPEVARRFAAGNPVDLVSDPQGFLYVLDAAAGRISRYDRDGVLQSFFGASGAGPAQLSGPQAFTIGPDGRFYVADTGNDRVQVFTAGGVWERTIGASGSGTGQLRRPIGIAVTKDRILISDLGNQRIAVFGLDGDAMPPFTGVDARGLVEVSGHGVLIASPQTGVLSIGERTIQSVPRLEERFAAGELGAPIDVSTGDEGIWLTDASEARIWSLTDSFGLRRVLATPTRLPLAVAGGMRRHVESVYVADGVEVTELALPAPSPLPVVQELKARLIAADIAGALAQIHPLQRNLFSQVYSDRASHLPSDGAAMGSFTTDWLREDRAIVRVQHTLIENGAPVIFESPIELLRAEDGTWQVYDY
jgi:hypothetical protein